MGSSDRDARRTGTRRVGAAAARDYVYRRLEKLGAVILSERGARRAEARAERDFLREQQRLIPASGDALIGLDPALERAVREAGRGQRGAPKGGTKPRQKAASAGASVKASAGAKPRRGDRDAGEGRRLTLGLRDQVMVTDGSHWAYGQIGRVIALTPRNATIRLRKSGGLHSIRELGPALEVGRDQLRSMEP